MRPNKFMAIVALTLMLIVGCFAKATPGNVAAGVLSVQTQNFYYSLSGDHSVPFTIVVDQFDPALGTLDHVSVMYYGETWDAECDVNVTSINGATLVKKIGSTADIDVAGTSTIDAPGTYYDNDRDTLASDTDSLPFGMYFGRRIWDWNGTWSRGGGGGAEDAPFIGTGTVDFVLSGDVKRNFALTDKKDGTVTSGGLVREGHFKVFYYYAP